MKFKVCKTDLGADKVYPEGSIAEFDEKADWVKELIASGNLEPVNAATSDGDQVPNKDNTVEEIKAWLNKNEIEFKPNANKATLLSLIADWQDSTVEELVLDLQAMKIDANAEEGKAALFNKYMQSI